MTRNRFTDYFTHTERAVLHADSVTPDMTFGVTAGGAGDVPVSADKRACVCSPVQACDARLKAHAHWHRRPWDAA